MAAVGCPTCGNVFESDKAKKERLITSRGEQISCVCPMCGSTGAGRELYAPDPENPGQYLEEGVALLPDMDDSE